ncbi:MAG: lysoplasmalogenase [Candidatus Hydrogenedentes bacterium]|nr:lysoplasmalogenase [Candidatus Hydrogenedentota bacterium]
MPRLLTLCYALLALLSVGLCFLPSFPGIGILRALPTALLAAAALSCTRARFGIAISLAVALGSAGDFFLATGSRAGFVPGLISFLLGHLAYLWAFSRDFRFTGGKLAILAIAVSGVAALAAAVTVTFIRAGEQALLAPVLIYVVILAATMIVCVGHRSPTPWIAVGGVVFVISDAHIAVNHMLLDTPLLAVALSGYSTYYLAQFLFVHGAACENRHHRDEAPEMGG